MHRDTVNHSPDSPAHAGLGGASGLASVSPPPLVDAGHSALAPAALIGPAHFSISLATNFCRNSGERRSGATTSAPSSFSRAATAGVVSVATPASLSRCTIAAGVPLGRKNASQLSAAKSVRPCSWAVARLRKAGERFLLSIVIALAVLPSMCGIAAAALRQ